jgi:NADH-quinone oxidoreductase subunit A
VAGTDAHQAALWPLALYLALAVAVAAGMLALSYLLGQRHMERGTGQPYESGIAATGAAESRFDVKYYLVAMFFLIFDVESIFIVTWAIALREAGWAGYASILLFNAVLLATLAYLWRTGALAWADLKPREQPRRRRIPGTRPDAAAGETPAARAMP